MRTLFLLAVLLTACASEPTTAVVRIPAALRLEQALFPFRAVGDTVMVGVRVDDADGRPLPGVSVQFTPDESSGDRFTQSTSVSGSDGVARTQWLLATVAGFARATATVPGLPPIPLQIRRDPRPAARLSLTSGRDTLTTSVGNGPTEGVVVRAEDAFGNPVTSLQLTASVSGGLLFDRSKPTDGSGRAEFLWFTDTIPGIQTLTVRGPGVADLVVPVLVSQHPQPRTLTISDGGTHACRTDHLLRPTCWGSNERGRLGTGDALPRVGPQPVIGDLPTVNISAGGFANLQGNGTCALTVVREIWCWGNTPDGAPPGIPLRLQFTQRFITFELGERHGCGVDELERLWCWGENEARQLGIGGTVRQATPVHVAPGTRFRDVAVGVQHSCGLTTLGRVLCWGSNAQGQIGDGSDTVADLPTPVDSDRRFVAIAAGAVHTCAIDIDRHLHCWGSNANGRVLGTGVNGSAVRRPAAVRPDLQFRSVSLGATASCGIAIDGIGWCWGSNSVHQLADPIATPVRAAAPIPGGTRWKELALGTTSGCGLTFQNVTRCWGFNGDGVIGLADEWRVASPQPVLGGLRFEEVATGFAHSCGRTAAGEGWCWGSNQFGLIDPAGTTRITTPRRLPTFPTLTAIAASNDIICGIVASGSVLCRGELRHYLGPSTPQQSDVPLPAAARSVHLGWNLGCATLVNDETWCWGAADGGYTAAAAPARVDAPEPLTSVTVGRGSACGQGRSGIPYCWRERRGADATIPVTQPAGNAPVTAVAAISSGICLVTGDGDTSCSAPGGALTSLGITPALTQLAPGRLVTCGLTAARTAVCWGNNETGQAGHGVPSEYAAPAPVNGGRQWRQIAPSASHTCALDLDGAAWCWGGAQSGELGNGASRYVTAPRVVAD